MNSNPGTNQLARRSIQPQSRPISIDRHKTHLTPPVERQSSQPIPIKIDLYTNDSDYNSVDSAHYDMLTWRMYNRIVNARRTRAFSRSNENFDEQCYLTKVDYYTSDKARMPINRDKGHDFTEHMPGHAASVLGRDIEEEFPDDDQVFVLELVD
ncbi:hypothetical protein ACHAW6_001361 [Cyclotella cf. meneghiniana]